MIRVHGYCDPAAQAAMLLDRPRVEAFAQAIQRVVQPGDVVMDVGTGSGLLALLAARAGARRVYAVEASAAAELARAHARENGFESVIEVLKRDLESLGRRTLDPAPNVVVSEMLGYFAPDEGHHHVYRLARRLAAPDARLIPSSYRVVFAPAEIAELEAELLELEQLVGLRLGSLAGRLRTRPMVTRVAPEHLLGPEVEGERQAADAPLPSEFEAQLQVSESGSLNAVVTSFAAELAPGLVLRTGVAAPATHWCQMVFPVHPPLPCQRGDRLTFVVRPRLVTDPGTYAWELRRQDAVRAGDALQSLVGDRDEFIAQLGLRLKSARPKPTPRLEAWRAALAGAGDDPLAVMAQRVFAAQPGRYADLADAEQEVRKLLRSAGALL